MTKLGIRAMLATLVSRMKSNPINWALALILAYIIRANTRSTKTITTPPKHPDVIVFQNYTPKSLLPHDGTSKDGRILIAVNGSVYDVTRGRNFYGPGGPYANFAGRDASRGLAKNSFDPDMLTDPSQPIDNLEDLTAEEWESLREWEGHFATKYLLVGKFIENE